MKKSLLTLVCGAAVSFSAQATVIGIDGFDYADGPIENQIGGTGFDYDDLNKEPTTTYADWDFSGSNVVSNALVTNSNSAKREYNGPIEGSAEGGDAHDTERAGAARGQGIIFYQVTINRSAGATWSGVSSYDFGSERVFFGVPSSGSGTDLIGIQESGVGVTLGSISLLDSTSYTMVAVLDFDNDMVGLFIDPDGSTDFWDPSDGSNSADVTREYNGTNWSTAVRLGSGGETTWDDLTVGLNDPTDVGLLAAAVPEPSTGLLGSFSLLLLFRRRR